VRTETVRNRVAQHCIRLRDPAWIWMLACSTISLRSPQGFVSDLRTDERCGVHVDDCFGAQRITELDQRHGYLNDSADMTVVSAICEEGELVGLPEGKHGSAVGDVGQPSHVSCCAPSFKHLRTLAVEQAGSELVMATLGTASGRRRTTRKPEPLSQRLTMDSRTFCLPSGRDSPLGFGAANGTRPLSGEVIE
jgi:hypothetical protein